MFLLQILPDPVSNMPINFYQGWGCRIPHRGRGVTVQSHNLMQKLWNFETLSTIPGKTRIKRQVTTCLFLLPICYWYKFSQLNNWIKRKVILEAWQTIYLSTFIHFQNRVFRFSFVTILKLILSVNFLLNLTNISWKCHQIVFKWVLKRNGL